MAETGKPAAPRPPPSATNYLAIDVGLRVLLFAATIVALVVMVTSKQTELAVLPGGFRGPPLTAKFNHSPAFVYFVAAMSVACLYSILTTLASLGVISKPAHATKFLLHVAFWDVLMLGIVASATGAAAAVAYIGLRGNSHVGWNEVCPLYDNFCRRIGSSVAISLLASILLVLLAMLSVFSLHRQIPE